MGGPLGPPLVAALAFQLFLPHSFPSTSTIDGGYTITEAGQWAESRKWGQGSQRYQWGERSARERSEWREWRERRQWTQWRAERHQVAQAALSRNTALLGHLGLLQ